MNVKNNRVVESSWCWMFRSKESQYYNLVSSSSIVPIPKYTKLGGNITGKCEPLISLVIRPTSTFFG